MKRRLVTLLWAVIALNLPRPNLFAQVTAPRVPARPAPVARTQVPHEKPCWEIAGISRSAMTQRKGIEQQARAQVESVCHDPSLSEPQKHAKIREIRQRSRQQVEGIISPQQQEALKSCQQERAAAKGGGVHVGGGHGAGPCDEAAGPAAEHP